MKPIQVLIVTMDLISPDDLLEAMNIQSSFVIGNQTKKDYQEKHSYKGYDGLIISRNEKGVGNNRNITLKYSSGDICLLADDDMVFHDNYPKMVQDAFSRLPNADVIIFNLDNGGKQRRKNTRTKKLNKFNCMNYGAARIAFLKKAISYQGITFNTNFGGGTIHSAGEDVLFICDCIAHHLNVYAIPEAIASLHDKRQSTWFNGYTDKYLFDKGVFLAVANRRLARLFALYLAIRHKEYKDTHRTLLQVYSCINKGIDYVEKKQFEG